MEADWQWLFVHAASLTWYTSQIAGRRVTMWRLSERSR